MCEKKPSSDGGQCKRRRFLIKTDIQFRIAAYIIAGMLITFLLCGLITINLIRDIVSTVKFLQPPVQDLIIPHIAESIVAVIVVFLLLIVFMILKSIYFSNRIAGPVYRMEVDLEKMIRERKISKICIRRYDYLHKLSGTLNKFLEEVEFKKDE